VSKEGVGVYAGLRAALPYIDLRVGGRYRYTFWRSFLDPMEHYTREDIEMLDNPHSQYLSWEAELTGTIPVGFGAVLLELAGTAVTGVEEGLFVYEETVRAVVDPPWVWRGLLGYSISLLPENALRLGVAGQVVGVPGRDVYIYRAGVIARMKLAYNLELRGTFLPAVYSPDSLGLASGDSFQLGVRYLWAYPGGGGTR
jgi:hypothetical protein